MVRRVRMGGTIMQRYCKAIFSLWACLFLSTLGHAQQSSNIVVLEGATVIDGLGGPSLSDAVVVVEGNEISSVSSGPGSNYPAGATILDVSGKFIIPGLIDTHVHWGAWMGEVYMNHGVTSVMAQTDASKEESKFTNQFEHSQGVSHGREFQTDSRYDQRAGPGSDA